MKRTFSFPAASLPLVAAGTALIAATYGLVRLAYGLFLPDVERDLGLDVTTAGIVSGGASVVYGLGATIGFLTAGRHPRRLVAAATLAGTAGAAGMAAAPSAPWFALVAIGASAAAGMASPAMVAVLQRNEPTRGRPRLQAVVNAGTGPGLVAVGILALVLLPDWRLAWMIAAVLTLAAGGTVLALDRARAPAQVARPGLPPGSWYAAHGRILVAALLLGAASAAVWTYGRTLLVAAGADEAVSTLAWIALGVGGTAVIVTAPWLERRGPRFTWMLTTTLLAAATAAVLVAPFAVAPAIIACAVFGWSYTAGSGALIAWAEQIDARRAAAGTAMLFVTLILGHAIGAAAVGAAIPLAGYPAAFLGAAVAAAAAVLPAWRVSPRAPRAPRSGSAPDRRRTPG